MEFPVIVSPDNEDLLEKLTGRRVALRVGRWDRIAAGLEMVRKSGCSLFCIIVESDRPVADIDFGDCPAGVPLALMAPSTGRFRSLARHLDMLRSLNLRVYLPWDSAENLPGLRILSSVGINCCAYSETGLTDWEALADLATYALLERAPHAAIEPFAYIASNYNPSEYLQWGRVMFDDPTCFAHSDEAGPVALSRSELARGRFVAQSPREISAWPELPEVRDRKLSWKRFFAENHPCASCAGWKICLGKFSAGLAQNGGCATFFEEMIDLVHRYRAMPAPRREVEIWRP